VCFDFLYQFSSNISRFKKNWVGYYHKCALGCTWSVVINVRLQWVWDVSNRCSKKLIKRRVLLKFFQWGGEAEFFHAEGETDGRRERNDVANSRFAQFCQRKWKCTWKYELPLCRLMITASQRNYCFYRQTPICQLVSVVFIVFYSQSPQLLLLSTDTNMSASVCCVYCVLQPVTTVTASIDSHQYVS